MAMKFGTSQISNPTPSKINLWVRVFTVAAGIFMLWLPTAAFIGPHSQAYMNSILGLFVALSNGLAPLFGIEVSDNQKVPAKDVIAMEDNTETKK